MNQEIIIHLIAQDMRHQYLISGLEQLGFTGGDKHDLDIILVVANLMGIENGKRTDRWTETYAKHVYNINTQNGQQLKILALECFKALQQLENK
jgi:hypothetical protein